MSELQKPVYQTIKFFPSESIKKYYDSLKRDINDKINDSMANMDKIYNDFKNKTISKDSAIQKIMYEELIKYMVKSDTIIKQVLYDGKVSSNTVINVTNQDKNSGTNYSEIYKNIKELLSKSQKYQENLTDIYVKSMAGKYRNSEDIIKNLVEKFTDFKLKSETIIRNFPKNVIYKVFPNDTKKPTKTKNITRSLSFDRTLEGQIYTNIRYLLGIVAEYETAFKDDYNSFINSQLGKFVNFLKCKKFLKNDVLHDDRKDGVAFSVQLNLLDYPVTNNIPVVPGVVSAERKQIEEKIQNELNDDFRRLEKAYFDILNRRSWAKNASGYIENDKDIEFKKLKNRLNDAEKSFNEIISILTTQKDQVNQQIKKIEKQKIILLDRPKLNRLKKTSKILEDFERKIRDNQSTVNDIRGNIKKDRQLVKYYSLALYMSELTNGYKLAYEEYKNISYILNGNEINGKQGYKFWNVIDIKSKMKSSTLRINMLESQLSQYKDQKLITKKINSDKQMYKVAISTNMQKIKQASSQLEKFLKENTYDSKFLKNLELQPGIAEKLINLLKKYGWILIALGLLATSFVNPLIADGIADLLIKGVALYQVIIG